MEDCNSFIEDVIKFENELKMKINGSVETLDLEILSGKPAKYIVKEKIIKFSNHAYIDEYSEFNFQDCIINDKLEFGSDSAFYKGNLIKDNFFIQNSIFNDEFNFLGKQGFECDVLIKDTYFKKKVWFDSMSFKKNVNFDEVVFCGDVEFNDCAFENVLYFRGIKVKGSLIFRNCKFTKEFNIVGKHSINSVICNKLIIESCNKDSKSHHRANNLRVLVKEGVEWYDMKEGQLYHFDDYIQKYTNLSPKVSFSNCHIKSIHPSNTDTKDGVTPQITVINSTILGETYFGNKTTLKPIEFKNCVFKDKVTYENTQFLSSINHTSCTFNESVDFRLSGYSKNKEVFNKTINGSFKDSVFEKKVIFYHRHFNEVSFENTKFNKLADFYDTTFSKPLIFFKTDFNDTSVFSKATFNGIVVFLYSKVAGNMILRNATLKKGINLALINFIGEGYLTLFDIGIEKKGDSSVSMPNDFDIDESKESRIVYLHKYRRETYRILKNEAINQNNRIQALEFHAKEMEAHTDCVKENSNFILYSDYSNIEESRFKKFTSRIISDSRGKVGYTILATILILLTHLFRFPIILFNLKLNTDLFVLRINQITNKHGSDWKRGFLFTIMTSAFFFTLYWISLKEKPVELNINASLQQTKGAIGIVLSYFAHFTNPTHWTTFMKDYKGDWSVFIDIISRVFIGLGLYQTIQAFRKYGRF